MIKRLFTFVILLGIVLLNTTCKKKLFETITYQGYVYNSSNQPQAGVTVVLNACGGGSGDRQPYGCAGFIFELGRSTTDASGHFYIHENAASTGWYYPNWNGMNFNNDGVSAGDLNSPQYTILYI